MAPIPDSIEAKLKAADYIVGCDEVGIGSWAGPLYVCAVLVSKSWPLAGLVKDSKQLQETQRRPLADKILPTVLHALVSVSVEEIDQAGIGKVLPAAHSTAIETVLDEHEKLGCTGVTVVIVDGILPILYRSKRAISLPKADALVPAVSAASIIAKVSRDEHMIALAQKFPGYGLEFHKGYGGDDSHAHTIALKKLGPCEIHRKSFAPIRDLMQPTQVNVWDLLGNETE